MLDYLTNLFHVQIANWRHSWYCWWI